MKRQYESDRSKFTALENQLLNTFYSGLYFSSSDFKNIAREVGIELMMYSRERLIKDLLNISDQEGKLAQTITVLHRMINERIEAYHRLSLNYPGATKPLSRLAQKATGTQNLLARERRGNPYEH